MRSKRAVSAFIVSSAVAAAVVLGSASTASAYGPSYCNSSSCSLSYTPSTGGIYYEMPRNTPVTMICWTDNQWWNGTNRWFKVNTVYGQGYMIATQVAAQTVVGHC